MASSEFIEELDASSASHFAPLSPGGSFKLLLTIPSNTTSESTFHDTKKEQDGKTNSELASNRAQHSRIVPSAKALAPRIPYNNGYGDFSFVRWCMRPKKWRDQSLRVGGVNGAKVAELGDFERDGPFEFFKLPTSVRFQIYELLLEPLHQGIVDKPTHLEKHIDLSLMVQQSTSFPDYEEFSKMVSPFGRHIWRRVLLGETVDNLEGVPPGTPTTQEYEEARDTFIHQNTPHPSRKTSYKLLVSPQKNIHAPANSFDDWTASYVEWLRKLSNVSNPLREEIGQAFWKNIKISYHWDFEDPFSSQLDDLLDDRPAIHTSIKHLHIAIRLHCPYSNGFESLERLSTVCQQKLNLDTFSVQLIVLDTGLVDMASNQSQLDTLGATRKIIVAKDFKLTLTVRSLAGNAYRKSLSDHYQNILRPIMLPDSLQPQEPTDAAGLYLQSRAQAYGLAKLPSSETAPEV